MISQIASLLYILLGDCPIPDPYRSLFCLQCSSGPCDCSYQHLTGQKWTTDPRKTYRNWQIVQLGLKRKSYTSQIALQRIWSSRLILASCGLPTQIMRPWVPWDPVRTKVKQTYSWPTAWRMEQTDKVTWRTWGLQTQPQTVGFVLMAF